MCERPNAKPWKVLFVSIFLLLSAAPPGYAQLGIGGGFELGTAAVINKGLFIGNPSIAISALVSYAPPYSRAFPSITYLLRNTVIPLKSNLFPEQRILATSQHFVLNLNYRTTEESYYHLFFWGIGIAKMRPETDLSPDPVNVITLAGTESSSHLYPMVQAGCKYMHRILPNSSFYVGLEANLKYIRMHSDNVYYIQQGPVSAKTTITGDLISPGLQIHLAYFFDGMEE